MFNLRLAVPGMLLFLLGIISVVVGLHTSSVIDTSAILFLTLQIACLATQISKPKKYFMGFIFGTVVYSVYSIYLFTTDISWMSSSYYVFRMISGGGIDPNVLSVGVIVSVFLLPQINLTAVVKNIIYLILYISLLLYFSRGAFFALLITMVFYKYDELKGYLVYILVALLMFSFLYLDEIINTLNIYVNLTSTFEGMSISSSKRLLAWEKLLNEFSFSTIISGVSFSGLSSVGDYGYTYPHSTPIAILFSFGSLYFILHYFLIFIVFKENKVLRAVIISFLICSMFVDLIYLNLVLLIQLMAMKSVRDV